MGGDVNKRRSFAKASSQSDDQEWRGPLLPRSFVSGDMTQLKNPPECGWCVLVWSGVTTRTHWCVLVDTPAWCAVFWWENRPIVVCSGGLKKYILCLGLTSTKNFFQQNALWLALPHIFLNQTHSDSNSPKYYWARRTHTRGSVWVSQLLSTFTYN